MTTYGTKEYPKTLEIKEAAEFLGYSPSWIRTAIKAGKIKCYRDGTRGKLKFKSRELQVSLENNFISIKDLERKKLL